MQRQSGGVSLDSYRIFETDEFIRGVEALNTRDKTFITKKLASYIYPQIASEPFFGRNIKKLKGYSPDTWRYRIGMYRIFYILNKEEKIIYILTIDHRKDAYR
jgi:mRNA interferase RelE/StbE